MAQVGNWTEERSTTQGTGDIILSGALTVSNARFRDSLQAGLIWYSIINGNNREAGMGTFDGTDTIVRTTIGATREGGVYNDSSPSPINLSGNSVVSCTFNTAAFRELEIGVSLSIRALTASGTLIISDINNAVEISNAGAVTLTVPPNSSVAFPIGTQIIVRQTGAGQITITAGAGVTLQSPAGLLSTALQYSPASLYKSAADTWAVMGDLA